MAKKYEFSPTRVLTVTGSAHKWYMCDIYEKGNPDDVAHISHRDKDEFERLRNCAMKAFAAEGKLEMTTGMND
jgi:hypothetical protein